LLTCAHESTRAAQNKLRAANAARDKAAEKLKASEDAAAALERARSGLAEQLAASAEEKRALSQQCEELGALLRKAQGSVQEHEKANLALCDRLTAAEDTVAGLREAEKAAGGRFETLQVPRPPPFFPVLVAPLHAVVIVERMSLSLSLSLSLTLSLSHSLSLARARGSLS